MASLARRLHAFLKDVAPRQEEWEAALEFLARTGQVCGTERQEFILLSDTLGGSMPVDAVQNRRPMGATERPVLASF